MSEYRVILRPEIHGDLDMAPANIEARILKAIRKRLSTAPQHYGEGLRRSLLGLWRMRVGDYRVVYTIENETRTVIVWAVAHRHSVYELVSRRWS